MESINAGWLSILPPIIAVVLALVTKEVFSSLLIGILSGTFIYTIGIDGNFLITPLESAISVMSNKFDLNIVLFCSLLGALVYVIYLSGGTIAYGEFATKRIKGRKSALVSTSLLGSFIFIDDYFNCLTVGTVMRPITDKYKIARAKLAYVIDSTAAPICIIAPISSWAAAVGSNLKETKAFDSDISAFIATIPWNFYAILCLILVFLVCFFNINIGDMVCAEAKTLKGTAVLLNEDNKDADKKIGQGSVFDMLLPIIALIVFAIIFMMYLGGYWGKDVAYHSFAAALGNTNSSLALVLSSFMALVVSFFMFVPRKILTLKEFMEGCLNGIKAMIPANMILTFAWTISGVTRDLLQAPQFIASIVSNDLAVVGAILPAVIFLIAAFLSFSTGTAWGTFGILIPIVVLVAQTIDPDTAQLVIISLSATLAGSVCGDHCSPISDTTVLSSVGSSCDHLEHVYTQFPYVIITSICTFIGYIIAGFTQNWVLSFGTALGLIILSISVIYFKQKQKEASLVTMDASSASEQAT